MPLRIAIGAGPFTRVKPTEAWQTMPMPAANAKVRVDENFYVESKNLSPPPTR
jgi:hypothetical protein